MTVSDKQKKANKKNSKKSTGPMTLAGKSAVSVNAVKHGILSKKLILPHENRDEFDALLDEMTSSLKPVGTMEQILVEKVTINLWRQRRLTNAESAQLSLQTLPAKISECLLIEQLGTSSVSVGRKSLDEESGEKSTYSSDIQSELEKLDIESISHSSDLVESAPITYASLQIHADAMNVSIDQFLNQQGDGITDYLKKFKIINEDEIEQNASRLSLSSQIKEWVIAKNAISQGELEKQLSRYQTSLDNELYKALRALREQQQWRRDNIEGEIID